MEDDAKEYEVHNYQAKIETEEEVEILEGIDGTFAVKLPLSIVFVFGKPPRNLGSEDTGHVLIPNLPSLEHAHGVIAGVMTAVAMVRISQHGEEPFPGTARH